MSIRDSIKDSIKNIASDIARMIQSRADTNLSNLSEKAEEVLDGKFVAQNMYETGAVLTDTWGYNQLVDMAHSTFDSSKLTVIGSPTVTEDGIVDNFSTSNYLEYTGDFALNSCSSFEIVFPMFQNSSYDTGSTASQTICCLWNDNFTIDYSPIRLYQIWDGTHAIIALNDNTGSKIGDIYAYTNMSSDTDYYIKLTWDGSIYQSYYSLDGINWTKSGSLESSTPVSDCNSITFGYAAGTTYTRSYIDMKPFSIKINGVPVLSFNETGMDDIKEDDYTIIGEPSISDDGILSNCSSGNVVQTPVTLSDLAGNSWSIKGSAVLGDGAATLVKLSSYPNKVYVVFGSLVWRGDLSTPWLGFYARTGTSDDGNNEGQHIISSSFEVGDTVYYQLNFDYDSGIYSLYADTTDGTTFIGSWTPDTSNKELYYINTNPEYYISLGGGSDSVYYLTTGSIDLNNFLVYINGDLFYQPCLKIPYTLSSTGSKIADVVYRSRVQNLYEQDGKALYYTLDEDNNNFTLPMGEIYGMITDTYTKTELDTALDEVMGKLELFAEELGVETNTDEAEE